MPLPCRLRRIVFSVLVQPHDVQCPVNNEFPRTTLRVPHVHSTSHIERFHLGWKPANSMTVSRPKVPVMGTNGLQHLNGGRAMCYSNLRPHDDCSAAAAMRPAAVRLSRSSLESTATAPRFKTAVAFSALIVSHHSSTQRVAKEHPRLWSRLRP